MFGGQRRRKRAFANHTSALQHMSSMPNRIFKNGKSRSSCIFTQQGRKGVNQDAMIVWEDFMAEDVTFCGVFDGHGPYGHLVARKVRDTLPLKLFSFFDSYESKKNKSTATICCSQDSVSEEVDCEAGIEDKVSVSWKDAFLRSYKSMDKELRFHPSLDCFCSGSTAVTIVKKERPKGLNVAKVEFFALQDEPEVSRVWLPFDDAPGLAMARAFGDFCLKEYGVISVPEFSHRLLSDRDKFIVLASDGIWDVLSNEEVIEIVSSASTRSSAARNLVDSAAREWKTKYPTSKMDDCAVICLFLDGRMDSESDCEDQGFSSATLAGESDDGHNYEPSLQRNCTVRAADAEENNDGLTMVGDEETAVGWSGLEGVTRVNSLVQLPRFSEETPKP
ncbi:hypothetical protein R6Q57_024932 [Mikania cordata]